MWQRKQTVFLALAIIAIIACLLLPLALIQPEAMGKTGSVLYNLGVSSNGSYSFGLTSALSVFLAVAGILSVAAIVSFRNRKTQMRLCSWTMLLLALWYVMFAVSILHLGDSQTDLHPSFGACLPLIAFILVWLGRRGVKADDDLVKSMDRIR